MTKRTLFKVLEQKIKNLTDYFEVCVNLVLFSFTATGKFTLHYRATGQFSKLLTNGYFLTGFIKKIYCNKWHSLILKNTWPPPPPPLGHAEGKN
jgi:hypothetical protein